MEINSYINNQNKINKIFLGKDLYGKYINDCRIDIFKSFIEKYKIKNFDTILDVSCSMVSFKALQY